jgi:hypothetical protein
VKYQTLGLVSVSRLRHRDSWSLLSLAPILTIDKSRTRLFVNLSRSLVSQIIGNLINLLRSRPVFISVLRQRLLLLSWFVPLLTIKKSRNQPFQEVSFSVSSLSDSNQNQTRNKDLVEKSYSYSSILMMKSSR